MILDILAWFGLIVFGLLFVFWWVFGFLDGDPLAVMLTLAVGMGLVVWFLFWSASRVLG